MEQLRYDDREMVPCHLPGVGSDEYLKNFGKEENDNGTLPLGYKRTALGLPKIPE